MNTVPCHCHSSLHRSPLAQLHVCYDLREINRLGTGWHTSQKRDKSKPLASLNAHHWCAWKTLSQNTDPSVLDLELTGRLHHCDASIAVFFLFEHNTENCQFECFDWNFVEGKDSQAHPKLPQPMETVWRNAVRHVKFWRGHNSIGDVERTRRDTQMQNHPHRASTMNKNFREALARGNNRRNKIAWWVSIFIFVFDSIPSLFLKTEFKERVWGELDDFSEKLRSTPPSVVAFPSATACISPHFL